MDGIILQLQKNALDESVDIETLMRQAYLIARKLKLNDFLEWISNEQNGYEKKVPEYRIVRGKIKAWNPYYSWTPIVMPGDIEDITSKMPFGSPIATISDIYNNSNGTVMIAVPGSITDFLNQNTNGLQTNYSFFSTKTEMHRIISTVRNKILEWAILLEENGIVGEGLDFTNDEKSAAAHSSIINNYINNFYSTVDNTKIVQGDTSNDK